MEDKKKKNDKIYLDKEALWVEVDKYYETDIISEELGQMIIDLANNIMSGNLQLNVFVFQTISN